MTLPGQGSKTGSPVSFPAIAYHPHQKITPREKQRVGHFPAARR